eukprot:gene16365-biopygen18790
MFSSHGASPARHVAPADCQNAMVCQFLVVVVVGGEDPRCGRRGGGDYTSCQGGLETAARDQKYNHDNNITDEVTAVCSPLPIPVCGLFLQEGGILAPGVRPSQGEVPFPFQPPPIRPRPARPGRASRASAHSGSPCTWSPEMFVARSEKGRPHRRPIRESQQQ